MKKLAKICTAFILFFLSFSSVFAVYDPVSVPNNRFGIHIADASDLEDAARLVNSSGGDWGYVTFVVTKTERDVSRWQPVFDRARRLHLIPIVRIATRPMGDTWEKPSVDEIPGWVSFLDSLNWVIKNRYVIIANEPNHGKEWGGEVNPEEYADYLKTFSEKLKEKSPDFFVLPAGLDASAPNSKKEGTMEESVYLSRMKAHVPDIFDRIDGWNSHSYPNPAFSGSADGYGKGTVRTFAWESLYLASLGVNRSLPVFITETGWVHQTDGAGGNLIAVNKIGSLFKFGFNKAWSREKVVAVTPFILSYNAPPFEAFSWKGKNGNFYPFYTEIAQMPKVAGDPIQENRGEIMAIFVEPLQLVGLQFPGIILVKNEGQAIWNGTNLSLKVNEGSRVRLLGWEIPAIEPGKVGLILFKGQAPDSSGIFKAALALVNRGQAISNSSEFTLFTVSSLKMQILDFFGKIRR